MFEWAGSEFESFMRQFNSFKEKKPDPITGGTTIGVEHFIFTNERTTITFTASSDSMRLVIKKDKDILKNKYYEDFALVKDDVLAAIRGEL